MTRERCATCHGLGKEEIHPGEFRVCADCKDDKQVAINTRTVPSALRRKFRVWCVERETTMQDAIVELIESLVEGKIELTSDKR